MLKYHGGDRSGVRQQESEAWRGKHDNRAPKILSYGAKLDCA